MNIRVLIMTLLICMVSQSAYSQEFKSVKIGNQVWMSEDLSVDRFRNGDMIPRAKTNEEWEQAHKDKKPAWCYVRADEYLGTLYNWYAVNDPRGLAPNGWRIPSDDDWGNLIDYLKTSMSIHEMSYSNKLKARDAWRGYVPQNRTGFNAVPVLLRTPDGSYIGAGESLFLGGRNYYDTDAVKWWTSTRASSYQAYVFALTSTDIKRKMELMGYGMSVRCLKDDTSGKSVQKPTYSSSEALEYVRDYYSFFERDTKYRGVKIRRKGDNEFFVSLELCTQQNCTSEDNWSASVYILTIEEHGEYKYLKYR